MGISHRFTLLVMLLAACTTDAPSAPAVPVDEPSPVDPISHGPLVAPASNLALSADTICIEARAGDGDRKDDVRITSMTGSEISGLAATITYGPGQPTGWLTTSFDQTTTPARLWLHADADAAPAGEWWADVEVTAPGGGGVRVIRVHFKVRPNNGDAHFNIEISRDTVLDLSPGFGTVAGNGWNCSFDHGTCSGILEIGTVLYLTATPELRSQFLWWEAPGCFHSRVPKCVLTITGDVTVTAFFYIEGYGISVTVVGPGADGVVEGSGFVEPGEPTGTPGHSIECQLVAGVQTGNCAATQTHGDRPFNLNASAGPGSVFVGWSGDCSGTSCVIEPDPGSAHSVTATFARQ